MAVYPLTDEFGEAQKNVNLGRRRLVAQAAHHEVRTVLKLCRELREHGLDDVLIGSYARDTGIWPGKDVDIFGKLTRATVESLHPDVAYQLFSALSRRVTRVASLSSRARSRSTSDLLTSAPRPTSSCANVRRLALTSFRSRSTLFRQFVPVISGPSHRTIVANGGARRRWNDGFAPIPRS